MRLYAISDLHVGDRTNAEALARVSPRPDDWLVLAGDLGETFDHLRFVFDALGPKFRQLIWVPGNHELWCIRDGEPRGQARYQALVELCRRHGVLTPEDPYPVWDGLGPRCVIAPLFLLYDYTFAPRGMSPAQAVEWAAAQGIMCADEELLDPTPHRSRQDWCRERCLLSERRLAAVPSEMPTVLVNHFPLRRELAATPAIPRFTIWCGTEETREWHVRHRALVVVSGHLHIRSTRWVDGVRFEEVSLGQRRQWSPERGIDGYLREILPGPARPGGVA